MRSATLELDALVLDEELIDEETFDEETLDEELMDEATINDELDERTDNELDDVLLLNTLLDCDERLLDMVELELVTTPTCARLIAKI